MTPQQKKLREVAERLDAIETRSAEIFSGEIEAEQDKELKALAGEKKTLLERRSAIAALIEADDNAARIAGGEAVTDGEGRERAELRSKSLLGRYLAAAVSGQRLEGPEAEFRAAAGAHDGIPIDLFEGDRKPEVEHRADAPSVQPSANIGVNLGRIAPAIFANSILPSLGVEMPVVPSGSYGQPRITTSLTAGPEAKGDARESSAAVIGVAATTPHRISGRLTLQVEDLMGSGLSDMESALRQNLQMVMADALDSQGLTGAGTGDTLKGLHTSVTADTTATNTVGYGSAVQEIASNVDGVWARGKGDLHLAVNTTAYGKFAALWRGNNADFSLADHLSHWLGGFMVHSRMPGTTTADALLVRRGQMGIRLAVCPVWARSLMIDDMFSDAARGRKHVTVHTILGDVLIAQPDAYKRLSFKTD